jgi:signal transduction histidine kinase
MTNLAPHEPARHKCLIYEGEPSEQLPVVVPLLMEGLEDNWRCLYLGGPEMVQMVERALADAGVDTEREQQRGSLILSSDRSHLDGGVFHPEAMVEALCAEIDRAVSDGFEGLCATGDMRWELASDENFEKLLEYETRLERVFSSKPLKGICQYNRATVPAHAVRNALVTHQATYLGQDLNQDNLFYLPPELILDGASRAKQGEWMCQQMGRVLNAERTRDKALSALKQSETRQRLLAEQLAEANRGLEGRVAERTAALEAANKELESFCYSVSHDLRAPLRSVNSFSAILAEDYGPVLGEKGARLLGRVRAAGQHMEELIQGLLTLSRVTRSSVRMSPLDLSQLAMEVAREVRETQPEREAEIVVAEGMTAHGDPTLLRAALTNLIGNAWKFTGKTDKPRIEVGRTQNENGHTVFFVADNGAGFDMEYAEKLFAPFQRFHGAEEFPGTGVGLATVQRILARHGGGIWAKSARGQGATFYFTLPVHFSDK